MNKKLHKIKYLASDFLSAALAWGLFYIFRKVYIESAKFGYDVPIEIGARFYLGLIIIPVFWLLIYFLTGYYRDIFRKSRLIELWQTFFTSIWGVLILFFVLVLDDTMSNYRYYYRSLAALFSFHFLLTYTPRLVITTITNRKIHHRKIGFNTLLIGSNEKAVELYETLEKEPQSSGNIFKGFVYINGNSNDLLSKYLPHLGNLKNLKDVIREYKIEEAIIAIESTEHDKITNIINKLSETNVIIKIIPAMYDIIRGMASMSTIYGVPLIEISHQLMPTWQENTKRIIDVVVSAFALIILSPIFLALGIGVKLSSKGPVFYSHERIGRYGKPFTIYKFRSMYTDAEAKGPCLSSDNDSRITPFGLFMRKMRFDELPQFYNVLIGDMSLVGPRPERQYFINKIVKKANHYYHLQKVRPGITSWGQVKYGYAENVGQMIERLKYDIIYIENMSLYADFKILIYTVITVLRGSGK